MWEKKQLQNFFSLKESYKAVITFVHPNYNYITRFINIRIEIIELNIKNKKSSKKD